MERQDGWYWVKPRGCKAWVAAWWDQENFLAGKAVYEFHFLVDEIGPRIPSPDEAPAPASAPSPCTHSCNFGAVHRAEDGRLSYDCEKCGKRIETDYCFRISEAAQAAPAPSVSNSFTIEHCRVCSKPKESPYVVLAEPTCECGQVSPSDSRLAAQAAPAPSQPWYIAEDGCTVTDGDSKVRIIDCYRFISQVAIQVRDALNAAANRQLP